MKALKYGFGLALIGGFTLMAACGGSSSDTSDSGAGASSAGANSTTAGDGSTPTAGSGSNVAGDTSVAGGDTAGSSNPSGGSGAIAGGPAMGGAGKGGGVAGAGTGGAGGAAAMNPKDCPAALPAGACMPLASNQERCVYGDQSCRCRAPQGGGMNNAGAGGAATGDMWQCTTVVVCPTAKPAVDSDCPQAGEVCTYTGNGGCVCNNNSKKWQCFGGMTGNGGAGGMSGTAGAGGGTAATPCPQMKPAADATCTGSNLCQYGKGTGCICDGMNWVCN